MGWKYRKGKNEEEIDYVVYGSTVTCNNLILPVLVDIKEDTEQSLIEIHHLYKAWADFFEKTLRSNKVLEFSNLPYTVVIKLNKLAQFLQNYLTTMGIVTYYPKCEWENMDPATSTPVCQYFYEALLERIKEVQDVLNKKGLFWSEDEKIDIGYMD